MQNSSQTIVPEWATVIQTLQDTCLQVAETNQLTRALRDEQRIAFKEMKENSKRDREDHLHEYREMRETIREEIKGLQELRKTMRENEEKFYRQLAEDREEEKKRDLEREKKLEKERRQRRKEFDAEMKERDKKFDAEMAKRTEKFDAEMKERDKKLDADMAKRAERFDAEMKERSEKFDAERKKREEEENRNREEYWRLSKETDKKIKELSTRFGTTTGNIIEGLMSSTATDMFTEAGYDMHSKHKNMSCKTTNPNDGMEVDVFLYNDTSSIAIEVKASCDKKDIDRFLQQMGKFRKFFPRYSDLEVLGAIAAVNYELDADDYARECGLIVVRTDSDNFFAIDPCDKSTLKRF